jgi:hypothetical protein
MNEKSAYFTPSPKTASEMSRNLLFGGNTAPIETNFMIDPEGITPTDKLPELANIVLSPVKQVCVDANGYEITGIRKDSTHILGKLSVNTNVDPPLAIYTEKIIKN